MCIRDSDETLKIFTERLDAGLGNDLQVSGATGALASAAASVPAFKRLIGLKENQISVLIGRNPGQVETKLKLLEEVIPPEIPEGLPSALLERRPDVLAAEQNVRFANAQIGVAQANYFPKLGLTTFFGKLSTPLSQLSSGNTNAWSIGGNLAGPIYQGGALRARKRGAVAAREQARAQYFQTALSAFRDVSDTLISRENFEATRIEEVRAVESSERAVRLATLRYVEGLSGYFEVLDAQQRLYPAQFALAQTEINRRLVVVQLYRALGGGWNLTDAQWVSANPLPPTRPAAPSPPPAKKH